jgi:hypothetical protein
MSQESLHWHALRLSPHPPRHRVAGSELRASGLAAASMQLGAFTHAGRQAALLSAGPCCSGGDESSGAGKALSEGSR